MNETLHQLGGLLLGSVPTIFLFLLLVILYRFLVYGPLTRVLNERRERTEGAIEQANAATAAAAPASRRSALRVVRERAGGDRACIRAPGHDRDSHER